MMTWQKLKPGFHPPLLSLAVGRSWKEVSFSISGPPKGNLLISYSTHMNIRWEQVMWMGWDRKQWGEATETRVELQRMWSFISFCTLAQSLPLPPLFTLSIGHSFFFYSPPSHGSVLTLLPGFHHLFSHSPPLVFLSFFLILLTWSPSLSSLQISQRTRLSTGPINWSGSIPCGYMTRWAYFLLINRQTIRDVKW